MLWLFAALGVLGACATILIVLLIVWSSVRPHPQPIIQSVRDAETYAVSDVEGVTGRDMVAIEIVRVSAHDHGIYSSYKENDIRNIILLNQSTGLSRRLLPDNKRFVFAHKFLAAVSDFESGEPARSVAGPLGRPSAAGPAVYYALEISDNNVRDGKSATHSLVVGSLDTGQNGVVLSGVQDISDMWMVDPKHLGVIVSQDEALSYRIVDLSAMRVTRSTPVNVG